MSDDLEWRSYADDTEATFNLYTPPPRLPRPDRAAALRDVETLLRRIHDVTEEADDVVRFYLAGDGAFLRDTANVTAADLAALIVDRVLGAEQDGGAAFS